MARIIGVPFRSRGGLILGSLILPPNYYQAG